MSIRRLVGTGIVLGTIAALAACGGGGGGSGASPSTGVASTSPTPSATAASTSAPLNGTAGFPQSITLPANDGYGGTMVLTLENSVSGATAAVSLSTSPPAGAPAPTGTDAPLAFVGLDVSAGVTLAGTPAFSFSVPGTVLQSTTRVTQSTNTSLLLAFFDATHASLGYQTGSTCSVSGATVTCPAGTSPLALLAGLTDVFELKQHALPTAGAGVVVATPSTISFLATGVTQAFSASESSYGGAYTAISANPAVATTATTDGQTFSVTSVGGGTTTITLSDANGHSTTVNVAVTITLVPVQ